MNKKLILGALSLFLLAGCASNDTKKEETTDESVNTTTDEAGGAQSSAEVTDADGNVTKADIEKEN
ncbi:hypothetical protein, partial [Dubosiella newyorkensis]